MKKVIIMLLLAALLAGCAGCAKQAAGLEECLAGRHKTAAEWNGGLAFLGAADQNLYWCRDGDTVVLAEGPCLPPVCADGDSLYYVCIVPGENGDLRTEIHVCGKEGGERTLDCALDDIFLVTGGAVCGRLGGCYVRYELKSGTMETVCEIPGRFDPQFYAGGAFYGSTLTDGRDQLALFRLDDNFEQTELSPGLQFAADGWGYGMDDAGRMRARLADGVREQLPLREEPLCGGGDHVLFFCDGKVWLREGNGEPEELFSAPVSLQLHSSLPGPDFQLCGNSVYLFTLDRIRLAEGWGAVLLTEFDEQGATEYHYRYDLASRTLELMLEER